ncbi:Uncharacterized conserved protein [Clostridium paraputrificum]|uniref:DUF488 domain-containing protein n=1 Tax=Clostridium paraputrificum TaxID=29363 RepID=UPI0006C0B7D8|nr:DUF488 domain-containing protein [Clostridium paraputrificum]CUQ49796.1 Uncharacterized conserved protein [Clostridium paraputrificum]
MEIFTIGHSNYDVERLIDMLRFYNINCVVDIRGTPYSKYNIQYNKEIIQKTLEREGFIYIYMAKELAAKRINKVSYNDEGYSDFEKVVQEEEFIKGMERLKNGCQKGYRIALLGAMQDPIRCHRAILVGRSLRDAGFKVKHILHDYSIGSQEDIEKYLLEKYYKYGYQLTLDSLNSSISEEDMIREAYKHANKEIGYRIEHIGEDRKKN